MKSSRGLPQTHLRRYSYTALALLAGSLSSTQLLAEADGEAGWYVQGRAAYSSVEDAVNSASGNGAGAPGAGGCLLELPGVGCLIPGGGGGGGSSSTSKAVFDDGMDLELAIGRQFRNGLRTELSLNQLQNDVEKLRDSDGNEQASNGELEALDLMANAWFDFPLTKSLVPYVGAGLGAREIELSGNDGSQLDDTVFGYQLGAGLAWALSERFALSLDYRYLDGDDPEFKNSAGDGIDSEFTAQTIGLAARYLFIRIPPPDEDGDGVPDRADSCLGTASGVPVDASGCPLDSDNDGVTDNIDQCPSSPAGSAVNAKGCPKDSDRDGVTDDKDQCPRTPSGTRVDSKGCSLDSDGDGVLNSEDECPNSAAGAKVLSNGCETLVLEGVQFETNSAKLLPEALDILNKAADALKRSRGFDVEIQGHTDDRGSAAYNLALSQRRAEAVREDLIRRGVSADRLSAKGYGETQPKVPNIDEASWAKNRRVELKVLQD